jgi:predicted dehydrogenase
MCAGDAMPETFRVAVIGSTGRGDYGHGLDTAWRDHPETSVVAVSDDNPKGLAATAKRLRVDKAFADYRAMLDAVRPDVVAIGPRWIDQHRDMAVAAAERGCHVYMEKPFCRTLAEADEIIAACEKTNVKLAVGIPTRYSPKLQTVRRLIAEGAIGNVLEYRARGKEDRRGGSEDLWVLGTHVLDMLHAIAGSPEWCAARILQDGRPVIASDVIDGPERLGPLAGNDVAAMFGMPGGATAYFASKKHAGGNPPRYGLRILGSSGILEIVEGTLPAVKYLGDSSWSPGRSSRDWQDVSSAGIGQPEPLSGMEYESRHMLAIRDLLDAIKTDRDPICGPRTARAVVEMVLAVFAAHVAGGPVSLPLADLRHPLALLRDGA